MTQYENRDSNHCTSTSFYCLSADVTPCSALIHKPTLGFPNSKRVRTKTNTTESGHPRDPDFDEV
ncbi:hypothetical protein L484_010128 [Morus notabilis]|uniref:Uncharacterized protein n=1 Tax=Morus notabilis TaxID=981085 RepID=W9QJ46_9ROSA|nr:hypothetical protein L484_010128 [Morus notabilis]